jgi:hypothetical protein
VESFRSSRIPSQRAQLEFLSSISYRPLVLIAKSCLIVSSTFSLHARFHRCEKCQPNLNRTPNAGVFVLQRTSAATVASATSASSEWPPRFGHAMRCHRARQLWDHRAIRAEDQHTATRSAAYSNASLQSVTLLNIACHSIACYAAMLCYATLSTPLPYERVPALSSYACQKARADGATHGCGNALHSCLSGGRAWK